MASGDIDWSKVRRVLVVKLRSIGDTVLATPSLIALRRFLPDVQIDILLETHVAPVLDGFEPIDNVIVIGKTNGDRLKIVRQLRRNKYDVAINLHGGTTATLLTFSSGAKHRIGFADYQYSFLYNHLLSSANNFWKAEFTHSAEQQLALLGFIGVPVEDRPKSKLFVTEIAKQSIETRLSSLIPHPSSLALLHPATLFATKQWSTENFARTAEFLSEKGFRIVAVAAKNEREVLENLKRKSKAPIVTFDDLSLPEITALAAKAKVFVGNDSGIAHIAAAVQTPSVVVFGSSNRNHWWPWTDAPNEIVFKEFSCQPCPGYACEVYGHPRCIQEIEPSAVFRALERILSASNS